MPGMENGAPERTEASGGSSASPLLIHAPPQGSHSCVNLISDALRPDAAIVPTATQVWQVIETEVQALQSLDISARFAPLPPTTTPCLFLRMRRDLSNTATR